MGDVGITRLAGLPTVIMLSRAVCPLDDSGVGVRVIGQDYRDERIRDALGRT